jgi:hypothetical protein
MRFPGKVTVGTSAALISNVLTQPEKPIVSRFAAIPWSSAQNAGRCSQGSTRTWRSKASPCRSNAARRRAASAARTSVRQCGSTTKRAWGNSAAMRA